MIQQALMPQPSTNSSHRPCNSLLLLSFLLNALCFAIFAKHGQVLTRGRNTDNLQGLGWSRKAAEEAEAAAEYHCSGHGYVFVDTFHRNEKGIPICECTGCFSGPDCSQMDADCLADANGGDPVFLEPFWIANAEAGATVVPAWYRMSYDINDAVDSSVSPELEKQISAIHALVGNAVTQGRYIVLGTGSTQLINAAINCLSPTHASNPAQVVAATPYYGAYHEQTELFDSADNLWKGDARAWTKRTKSLNSTTFIESGYSSERGRFGRRECEDNLRSRVLLASLLCNLSAGGGGYHAFHALETYRTRRKQARTKRTEAINKDNKQMIFHYAYSVMRSRWERIESIFNSSNRFSLQSLGPLYCDFFRKVIRPSPAYAWVKCEREEEENCATVFERAGIIGQGGQRFGVSKRYIRLSLLKRDDTFIFLERRLQFLVWYNTTEQEFK